MKNTKPIRNFIHTTAKELKQMSEDLQRENIDVFFDIFKPKTQDEEDELFIKAWEQKSLVAIKNKTPQCIDTWRFEK